MQSFKNIKNNNVHKLLTGTLCVYMRDFTYTYHSVKNDESLKANFDLQNKLQCYSTLNRTTKLASYLFINFFKKKDKSSPNTD